MSAGLQNPPEHSRILSTPSDPAPSQPWTKIIIGFTLGVVCTFLLSMFVFAPSKAPQPQSRVAKWAESKNTEAAKAPGASSAAKSAAPAESGPDESASPPAPAAANAPQPEAQAQNDPCDQQTWPYVSAECAAQRTRAVRVITTDKSAPSTIVTPAPVVPPRPTDGQAARPDAAPSQTAAPPSAAITQPAPPSGAASTEAAAQAREAPAQSTAVPAQPQTMPAQAKPEAVAKTEPVAVDTQTSVAPARSAQDAQPSKKSRERRESRHNRNRRDNAKTEEARRDNSEFNDTRRETVGSSDARYDDPSQVRQDSRRTTRSRAVEDSRAPRQRAVEVDDDDTMPARSSRRRDERRRIVIEQPAEEDRTVVREQRPKASFPFFFLNGPDRD